MSNTEIQTKKIEDRKVTGYGFLFVLRMEDQNVPLSKFQILKNPIDYVSIVKITQNFQ